MRFRLLVLLAVFVAALVPASASAAGTVSGTVRADDGGAAVPSHQVVLYNLAQTKVAETCTAADGTYSVNVANGSYFVRFAGAGTCGGARVFAPEWFSNRYTLTFAEAVTVADANVTGVDASLAAHAQVAGTVTRRDGGAAIGNVEVAVLDIAQRLLGQTCTAANGTYTVSELPPGPHIVRFVSDGACGAVAPYAVQFYDEADSLQAAGAVNVGVGDTRTAINARLRLPAARHALTLSATGTGTGRISAGELSCTDTCHGLVEEGTVVSVTVIADAGSAFAGWGGACTGTGACAVTVGAPATVTAAFTRAATPTPTVTATPTNTPTPTPPGGNGPAPQPGTPGDPAATGTRPACKLTATAKTRGGKLKVAIKCDQRATLTLTGTVKVARKTLKLKRVRATAATRTVSIRLPAAARSAVRARRAVSASLTLVASNAAGETRTTARVKRLR